MNWLVAVCLLHRLFSVLTSMLEEAELQLLVVFSKWEAWQIWGVCKEVMVFFYSLPP